MITECAIEGISERNPEKAKTSIEKKPVTIKKTDSGDLILSYQADVKVYEENNREPGGNKPISDYRLSMKIIDGSVYTRIDYPEEESGLARSLITSSGEIISFNRRTNEIFFRSDMPSDPEDDASQVATLFERIPVSEVINYYSKLSYKITNDQNTGLIAIEFPGDGQYDILNGNMKLQKEIYYFDEALGVPCGYEYVTLDEEDVEVTTTMIEYYQDFDGIPILVGTKEIEVVNYPNEIDTTDRLIPNLEAGDILPAITESELLQLEENGVGVIIPDAVLGNPGDKDYTLTTTEEYGGIELNALEDSYFRINF